MDEHSGRPDLDPCSLVQGGLFHLLTIHRDPIGGTKIDDVDLELRAGSGYANLGMTSGYPGVIDSQVGVAAATDHQPRRLQRVPGAIDLEYQRCSADGSFTRPAGAWSDAGHRLR